MLPNKVLPVAESILPKLPLILDKLRENNYSILSLYEDTQEKFNDVNEFIFALDVLFVLDKIEFIEGLKELKYVNWNYLW